VPEVFKEVFEQSGAVSIEAAIWAVATLTASSGLAVIVRMYETNPPAGRHDVVVTPTRQVSDGS
jgi:hypothetical protein